MIVFVKRRLVGALAFALLAGIQPNSSGQDTPQDSIRVSPMAVPEAPLRYRLLPDFDDQIPGNAVVWYGQVFAEQQSIARNTDLWRQTFEMLQLPVKQLAKEHPEFAWLGRGSSRSGVFGSLRKAALSEQCDWQLGASGEPFFEILLPEIQQARSFARLIALRARYQIAEGRFDDAIATLQSGFALARNMGTGEALVCSYVALSIEDLMNQVLIQWVQQPDAPNLTWALTSLPNPLVDSRPGIEADAVGLENTYPIFQQARRIVEHHQHPGESDPQSGFVSWPESQWTQLLRDYFDSDVAVHDGRVDARPSIEWSAMEAYPIAKSRLIAAGFDAETIDRWPVAKVIAVQSFQAYNRQREDSLKWVYLPTPIAMEALAELSTQSDASGPAWPVDTAFIKSMKQLVRRQGEVQRWRAVVRVIEGVRHFAATHDGRLPQSLAEIDTVPIPNDPLTGLEFGYEVNGRRLIITTSVDAPKISQQEPIEVTLRE